MSVNKFIKTILILTLTLTIILAGCVKSPDTATNKDTIKKVDIFAPNSDFNLKSFKTEDEFKEFFSSNSKSSYYGGGIRLASSEGVMEKGVADASVSNEYSQTNNQVKNVDEADIIKTDGKFIYTLTNNVLYIVDAYPGEEAKVISTINFDSQPTSLFIEGNHLAVFGNYYNASYFKKVNLKMRNGMTFFSIYDITDKKNPVLVKDYKFEGYYSNARLIDGVAYFITMTGTDFSVGYPTPFRIEGETIKSMPVSDIYFYPMPYSYAQLANIYSIDIKDSLMEVDSKSITVEGGANIYVSENNIFLTYTEYVNEWMIRQKIVKDVVLPMLDESDLKLIEKIKNTDDEVLTSTEKESKIMQIIYDFTTYMNDDERESFESKIDEKLSEKLKDYKYFEYTIINKIELNDGKINIIANSKVPGHIVNQFSLDEKDEILRIATTISQRWLPVYYTKTGAVDQVSDSDIAMPEILPREQRFTEETNNIYTLNENLEILDSFEEIANGEQIYSTRFIGDRLYMVTFKQVDPFFVFDLTDPKDIKELGKLKIPGFSRYLHEYDENTIIGIGRDATESGRTEGLKISLFDVSDVNNPKEIAKFVTLEKYAQSSAEWEHKAFLFSKEKNLLVIPAYNQNYYNYDKISKEEEYNGAMVFDITKDSIKLRGVVDHSNSQRYYYQSLVERSLYINELLYTKSPGMIRINKIEDLTSVKKIELPDENGKMIIV